MGEAPLVPTDDLDAGVRAAPVDDHVLQIGIALFENREDRLLQEGGLVE